MTGYVHIGIQDLWSCLAAKQPAMAFDLYIIGWETNNDEIEVLLEKNQSWNGDNDNEDQTFPKGRFR